MPSCHSSEAFLQGSAFRMGTATAVPGDASGNCRNLWRQRAVSMGLHPQTVHLGWSFRCAEGWVTGSRYTARAPCRVTKALGHCDGSAKAQRGGCAAAHDVLKAALGLPGSRRCRPCMQGASARARQLMCAQQLCQRRASPDKLCHNTERWLHQPLSCPASCSWALGQPLLLLLCRFKIFVLVQI